MLEIRPSCECCDRNLAPTSTDVLICAYECTWCRDCAENALEGICPNCGGELVRRPVPSSRRLANDPPTGERTFNPDCMALHA